MVFGAASRLRLRLSGASKRLGLRFFFWRGQPGAAPTGGGGDSSGGEINDDAGLGWGGGGLPDSPPCSLIAAVC